jgi:hypothetical protein
LRARRARDIEQRGSGFSGPLRFRRRPDEERKIRFRETLKPLKSLKTAKSWLLRPGLIKGLEGCTISRTKRFVSFSLRFRFACVSSEIHREPAKVAGFGA